MEDRFLGTRFFILFSVLFFALLNAAFPAGARYVLQASYELYLGPQGQLALALRVTGLLVAAVLCYLLCAWAVRRLAQLTDSPAFCRGVLILGALCTAGHLVYSLWGHTGSANQNLLLRLVLTGLALAICASTIAATRFGPGPEFDYSEYRS